MTAPSPWRPWRARRGEWAPARRRTIPGARQNGFRLLDIGHDEVRWKDGEREVAVIARRHRDGGFGLELPGGTVEARVQRADEGRLAIRLGSDTFTAAVVRRHANDGGSTTRCSPTAAASACAWSIRSTSRSTRRWPRTRRAVRSPLPGKIIDLRVKAGDTVSSGQPLLVLEAMKMEHTLTAPADGTVKSVRYGVGEQVPEGAELVEFE